MKTGLTEAIFSFAVLFSVLAAGMAFLISYDEYRHHYPDWRQSRNAALQAAVFALAFFLLLGLVLAIVLPILLDKVV